MPAGTIGRVQSPRIIRIGGDVAAELPEVLAQLGLSRPLIVTDPKLAELHLPTVTDFLEQAGLGFGLFDNVVEDPTDVCVEEGLAAFRSGNFDCVIGFGGGSPMDAAKAISFMAVNPGHVRDYKAPCQIDRSGVPIILI
ncbi:MAG: iron-containing alcohol dehydrogenase, partial [Pseudomonadota bacterium]